ncbi:MAG: hypothetical protein H6556_18720 [Lewinellaceae bacterium]|nr:hypothetical protein [Lewinellaceae bacterium]
MVSKKQLRLFLLLTGLALFSSCGHLIHLDRAQNSFNRGAALENQLRFSPQTDISASPSTHYTLAYAELDKALNNKKGLSADNVLGTAYTIKALCEWKLGLYGKAEKSASDALDELEKMEKGGIRLPRDKALMKALPALMEIGRMKDTLYAFHRSAPSFEAGKAHCLEFIYDPDPDKMARLEKAIWKIADVQSSVASNEELSAYFIMSQLAGLKTWSDTNDFLFTCITKDPALDPQTNRAARVKANEWVDEQVKAFEHFLKEKKPVEQLRLLIPDERGQAMANRWAQLLGVAEDEE